jgi:hypothetical protein
MDKQAFDSLIQFCADQVNAFDPRAWTDRRAVDGKAIAMAAKYLSMTSWYGHEIALEGIAATTQGDFAGGAGFDRELQAMGFDLGHFSAAVRYAIVLRQEAQSSGSAERDRGGLYSEGGFRSQTSSHFTTNRAAMLSA